MPVEENWTACLRSITLARLAEEGIGEIRIGFNGYCAENQVKGSTSDPSGHWVQPNWREP
jgi:hypothetical protein